MNKINIGLTIAFTENDKNYTIFANGLRQHMFFLADTLEKIDFVDNVYIVNFGKTSVKDVSLPNEIKKYKIVDFDSSLLDALQVVIEFGVELSLNNALKFKNKGAKLIGYGAGNGFFMNLENILFKDLKGEPVPKSYIFNTFWTNAQHINSCYHYWRHLYKTTIEIMPHVWSPKFLSKDAIKYSPKNDMAISKVGLKLGIFEPNLNVVKSFIYPLLAAEEFYETSPYKDKLNHVFAFNTYKLKDKVNFKKIIKPLEIVSKGIATFENRFLVTNVLGKYVNATITHQIENGLNYLYYEMLYLNYPLIHNSTFLRDGGVGYYYNMFDIVRAKQMLEQVIEEYDKNFNSIKVKNKSYLYSISPDNSEVVEAYKKSLEKLF